MTTPIIITPALSTYLALGWGACVPMVLGSWGLAVGKPMGSLLVIGAVALVVVILLIRSHWIVIDGDACDVVRFGVRRRFERRSIRHQSARSFLHGPYDVLVWDAERPKERASISLKFFAHEDVARITGFLRGDVATAPPPAEAKA